jgi:hypothetical protein
VDWTRRPCEARAGPLSRNVGDLTARRTEVIDLGVVDRAHTSAEIE